MKLFCVVGILALANPVFAAAKVHKYDNWKLRLGLAFQAKELCSCLYVSGRSEADCRDYTKLSAVKSTITIDSKAKQVKARYYLFSESAHFTGVPYGCQLD